MLIGGTLYLLADAYLLALGEVMGVALLAANAVFVGLLLWLTVRLTRPLPAVPDIWVAAIMVADRSSGGPHAGL
jgi:hypothetical protein